MQSKKTKKHNKSHAIRVPQSQLNSELDKLHDTVCSALLNEFKFLFFFHLRVERIWLLCKTLFLQQCQRWKPFENINTSASDLSSQHQPELWQKYRNPDMTLHGSSCLSVLNSVGRGSQGNGWEWWFARVSSVRLKSIWLEIPTSLLYIYIN